MRAKATKQAAAGAGPRDAALWDRVQRFPVGAGGITLQKALEDDTGHNADRVARIILEYRRFLYLVAVGDGLLAPSRLVDRAWHLHLADAESYTWFCQSLFGRQIRHVEGRPPPDDDPAYGATLQAIRREFGHAGFRRVWPVPGQAKWSGRWAGAVFGFFALAVIALFYRQGGLALALLPGSVLSLILSLRLAPWPVKDESSGGCGGTTGCGGD